MNNFIFSNMVATVGNLNRSVTKTISKEDYATFQKEFVFHSLAGKRFGLAFCEQFDIDDFMLKALNDETAQYHIEKLGYIQ